MTGSQTSEFKFAVLAAVAGIVLVVAGLWFEDDTTKIAGATIVTGAVTGYGVSRGLAKRSPE